MSDRKSRASLLACAGTAMVVSLATLPPPTTATYGEVVTSGSRAAQLESVIVTLSASTVTALNSGVGEFTVTDSGGGPSALIVDDD